MCIHIHLKKKNNPKLDSNEDPPKVRQNKSSCAFKQGKEEHVKSKESVPTIVQFDDERVIYFYQDVSLHFGTDSIPNWGETRKTQSETKAFGAA